MNIRSKAAHRQSGIALIELLAVLVIVSATILPDRLGGQANASAANDIGNATALAEAKAALIRCL
jgi:type II secretory pathway pseudopilin PulG